MVSHFQIRFCVNWLLMQVHEVPVQFRFTQTIRASNLRAKYKFVFSGAITAIVRNCQLPFRWRNKQYVSVKTAWKKTPWNWLSESQLFVITVDKSIFVECNSRVPLFRFTPLFNWFWSSCHLNQISCKEWHRLWPSHLQFPALQVVLLFWFWLFIYSLPCFTSLWLAVVTTFVGFYETHLKNAQHIRRYDLLK